MEKNTCYGELLKTEYVPGQKLFFCFSLLKFFLVLEMKGHKHTLPQNYFQQMTETNQVMPDS